MSEQTRTVYLDDGEQKLELQRYRLVVTDGPGEARSIDCDGRRTTIGSSPDNDVVLDDPAISRIHAVIEVDGEGVQRNGTFRFEDGFDE